MDKPNRKQNPRRKRLQPLKRTGRTQFHRAHIPELINSPIPAPGRARLRTWSSTAHERHLAKSSSHFLAGEPGSSPGSRRTPSQGGRGECSNCVLILRFRKLARACKAVHRACEQSTPQARHRSSPGTPRPHRAPGSKDSAPRLENITAVSRLTQDRKLRLLNQDRQKINRLRTHFRTQTAPTSNRLD